MAFFLVTMPEGQGVNRSNKTKGFVIEADSSTIAKQVAAATFEGDSDWTSGDVTAVDISTLSASDLEGWTYRVIIGHAPDGEDGDPDLVDVSHTAESGDDFDDVGAALVTALNATTPIAGAAYSTPNLTVAETTDDIGDHTLVVTATPPGGTLPVPGQVGALTHHGAHGAALKVALVNATAVPKAVAIF